MTKKTSLILLAAITLFSFISCNQNVDTNTYVKNSSDFNSLADGEWRISTTTVPEGTAYFNSKTNIVTFKTNAPNSVGDEFSYFFRNGKLTLRDKDPNGEYKALNNASTRVTIFGCGYDFKGNLSTWNLGLIDVGLNLYQRTFSEAERAFENNFALGWTATCGNKKAVVSINAKDNEMIFTVPGGTKPSYAYYSVKEVKEGNIVLKIGNVDYTSDFYFAPGELTFKPSTPNKEVEISVETPGKAVKLTKQNVAN